MKWLARHDIATNVIERCKTLTQTVSFSCLFFFTLDFFFMENVHQELKFCSWGSFIAWVSKVDIALRVGEIRTGHQVSHCAQLCLCHQLLDLPKSRLPAFARFFSKVGVSNVSDAFCGPYLLVSTSTKTRAYWKRKPWLLSTGATSGSSTKY